MAECQYLFDKLFEVEKKILGSKRILLGMDHDGTIAEIITTLQEARMTEDMREILKRLSRNSRICMAFVSGRILDELKSIVKIENVFYAGNHGFQIEGFGADYTYDNKKVLESIRKITEEVKNRFKNIDGVVFEEKVFTTSFHFRNVKQEEQDAVRLDILNTLKQYNGVRIVEGKKLFNIRPLENINKGTAIETIGKHFYKDKWRKVFTVIFLGDDNSDEDALKILEEKDVGIIVNEHPPDETNARYYVKNVKEVEEFFKWVGKKIV